MIFLSIHWGIDGKWHSALTFTPFVWGWDPSVGMYGPFVLYLDEE